MKRKGAFDHILLETTGLADPGTYDFLHLYVDQCPNVLLQDP